VNEKILKEEGSGICTYT